MDQNHLWQALRYTELNPVRAGLVKEAESWKWSSAALHCGKDSGDAMVDLSMWRHCWTEATWGQFLHAREEPTDVAELRRCTFSGRPMARSAFVEELEQENVRKLPPRKAEKAQPLAADQQQGKLTFAG